MKNSVIEAAVNGKKGFEGKAYMFQGGEYIRYDWGEDKPDNAYPKNLSLWKLPGNFANGVDAAINGLFGFDGFVYLFKDDEYVKYSWGDDEPLEGYPKPLSLWKLPANFSEGIDGACNGRGDLEGFGYLFKDDQYVKYNWEEDRPELGYPRSLSSWKLSGEFSKGVDCVLNGVGKFSNFLYFFKGEEYMRYDWKKHDVEGPWPIEKYWHISKSEKEDETSFLFKQFGLEGEIDFEAFRIALAGYRKIDNGDCVSNATRTNRRGKKEQITYDNSTGYLIIVDFTKPSNQRRMVILNMLSGTKRDYLYVSHGVNTESRVSGDRFHARHFSNTPNTNKSSLGFFITGWAFPKNKTKKDGTIDKRVWLKLHGLETGINDKAQRRGIMMHTASYVNEKTGRVGKSHGCPAISPDENEMINGKLKNALFELIKDGNLLFSYTDKENATDELGNNYYDQSRLLKSIIESN